MKNDSAKSFRVMIKTQRDGKKLYFIQKRFMWYFWIYLKECLDLTFYNYKIYYDNLEGAKERIQQEINNDYTKSQSKIVKREIVF